jgi:uncharacterized protein (TIGR03382 family)
VRRGILLLLILLAPAGARANGAFPDSLQILLPPDQPEKITLATNFGLVFSGDGGRTWEWTCEHSAALGAILYQLAPPPRGAIHAVGLDLVRSTDDGCHWQSATGRAAQGFLYDVFVDPTNASRVLAVVNPNDESPTRVHVFESTDGGATFSTSVFRADPGTDLNGLEIAFGDPRTFYVTWTSSLTGELRAGVTRVTGAEAQRFDLFDTLGSGPLGIAAVDRRDPRKLYLRAFSVAKDRLAISEDGGATARVVLEVAGALAGLVVRDDGTLLAVSRDVDGGMLWTSRDGGQTFTSQPGPRFRALGERAGRLYAAADDLTDKWALGTSDDDGKTWQPILRFRDIARVKDCPGTEVVAACMSTCVRLASLTVIEPKVCGPGAILDAGLPPDAAANADAAAADAAGGIPPLGGCGCAAGGLPGSPALALLGLLAWLVRRAAARRESFPRR